MATTCFHHADRPTGRSCTRCGRPACPDCLDAAPVGSHCWECVKAARPPTRERIRRWNARNNLLVTHLLIATNLAAFVAGVAMGASVLGLDGGGSPFGGTGGAHRRFALFGPAVDAGEWYRLLTSGFVHYGVIHLVLNMVALQRLGAVLEPALGRIRLAALYVAALLAGSFGALLLAPGAFTAGASGAVFGLLGALAVGLHLRGVDVWRTSIGSLILVNLLFTFAVPGISIGGHLGGFVAGALMGAVMLREPASLRSVVKGAAVGALVGAVAVAGTFATTGPGESAAAGDLRGVAESIEVSPNLFVEGVDGVSNQSVIVVGADADRAAFALERAGERFLNVTRPGAELGPGSPAPADGADADPPFTPAPSPRSAAPCAARGWSSTSTAPSRPRCGSGSSRSSSRSWRRRACRRRAWTPSGPSTGRSDRRPRGDDGRCSVGSAPAPRSCGDGPLTRRAEKEPVVGMCGARRKAACLAAFHM